MTCPVCGGRGVPVVYGLPGVELAEAEMAGEVVLGGCILATEDVQCLLCGARWMEEVGLTTPRGPTVMI